MSEGKPLPPGRSRAVIFLPLGLTAISFASIFIKMCEAPPLIIAAYRLGRLEVAGGTEAQRVKFYTDLWHALLGRRTVSALVPPPGRWG